MPSVFRINKDGDAVICKDAIKLTQYLSRLDTQTLLYVILSEDHTHGPFHRKPKIERQALARIRVWGKKPPALSKIKYLQEACEEYQSLIFDTLRYKREIYTAKLVSLGKSFEITEDPSKLGSIMKAMDSVEEKIHNIDSAIDQQDERIELSGDKEITLIERFIRNRKHYKDQMHS